MLKKIADIFKAKKYRTVWFSQFNKGRKMPILPLSFCMFSSAIHFERVYVFKVTQLQIVEVKVKKIKT